MSLDSESKSACVDPPPQDLIDKLIAEISELDGPPSPPVEAALRTVPRHLFVPQVSMDEAYADDSVIMKRNEQGAAISAVSAPQAIALMLDQL